MKIFDCFQYFNESHIADLRFHILDKYVDFFVIVESTVNHQGEAKELSFDIRNYSKFKDKIIYIVVDDTPESIKIPHVGFNTTIFYKNEGLFKNLKKESKSVEFKLKKKEPEINSYKNVKKD